MGLLALDVSRFGVVMSADSQPIELLAGRNRVVGLRGQRSRNPIVTRCAGGFVGLLGYVGRNQIEGLDTRSWLERFGAQNPTTPVADFCNSLSEALTMSWQRQRLKSGLWIFVSGMEGKEIRFWFVSNLGGDINRDGTYSEVNTTFNAVNDLDENYVAPDLDLGLANTKEELLRSRMYLFRNGALRPSVMIFDAFSTIMQSIYVQGLPDFPPIGSLDDLAFIDRQRIEFTKRIYNPEYGVSRTSVPAIGGVVHVFGVTCAGEIRKYSKGRDQVKTIYP